MAYDGFFSGLSSRGSVNEILNESLQVQQEVEAAHQDVIIIRDQVEASKASIDESVIHVDAVKDSVDTSSAAVEAALIEVQATDLRTKGYADEAEASKDAAKISEDNAKDSEEVVLTALADVISVKRYGAIGDGVYRPVSDWYTVGASAYRGYANLAAVQVDYPHVTSATQSVDWAGIQAAINTGGVAHAPRGIYILTDTIVIVGAKSLIGDGVDCWDPLAPAVVKKNSNGTHLQMYGTGAKTYTCYGVSDNAVSGGAFANPEPHGGDNQFSLESFHNGDASGSSPSTLKTFSCAIYISPNSRGATLKGFRAHPYFNGISGYNNTYTTGLGDDWGVGIYNDNSPEVVIEDVQCVGYWRIAALLQSCVSRPGVQGSGFHCRYNRIVLQGKVGFMLRGGDSYRMIQRTATTLDIPFQNSHPFPASGGFNTNIGNISYTSLSVVNDGTFGQVLRFNGITADTSGVTQVRISSGWGIGGMTISNYIITGLEHSSGFKSHSVQIGLGVSKALELSGTFRQPFFSNGYIQSAESVLAHIHNVDDLRFVECQFESNGKLGRMIASPQDLSNTRVPYANGSSSITMIACHRAGTDEMPTTPRSFTDSGLTGVGFWQPRRIHDQDFQYPDSGDMEIRALNLQHMRMYLASGRFFSVRDSSGSDLLSVQESNGNVVINKGQLSFIPTGAAFINAGSGQTMYFRQATSIQYSINGAGTLSPGTDNTQNLGSASLRMQTLFAGTGTISTSDRRKKDCISDVLDKVLDAWESVEYKQYKFLDAVGLKGPDARIHVGVIAQQVKEAFEAQGLDAHEYGVLCYDEWEATEAVLDNDGAVVEPAKPAGNSYGIRYEEALALEAALYRRKVQSLEDRIKALEAL